MSWREESSFQGLCINYHHGEHPGEEANAAWLNIPGPGCCTKEVTVDTCPLKDDLEQTRKTSNVKVSLRWGENQEKEGEQSSLGKDIMKKASFWEVMPSGSMSSIKGQRSVSLRPQLALLPANAAFTSPQNHLLCSGSMLPVVTPQHL